MGLFFPNFQNFWVFAIVMQTPKKLENEPIFLKMGTFYCQNDP